MSIHEELRFRAQAYANEHGLPLADELGHGVHGIVFATEGQVQHGTLPLRSAIKAHLREIDYCRERDVYLRLQSCNVTMIRGFHVPQLLRFDDGWLIVDMTIVQRPFVLDFAGAYLDRAPDFSEEVMADWRADKLEQFGERWPEVEAILRVLETYGVYMEDVHPNNISFAD
jgi:hypothetical protein